MVFRFDFVVLWAITVLSYDILYAWSHSEVSNKMINNILYIPMLAVVLMLWGGFSLVPRYKFDGFCAVREIVGVRIAR